MFLQRFKIPESYTGRLLLLGSVLQAVFVNSLEIAVAVLCSGEMKVNNPSTTGIPLYILIFILSQLWGIGICWNAIVMRNSVQLFTFVMFNFCTFIYSIFQSVQLQSGNMDGLKAAFAVSVVLAGILAAFTSIFAYISYRLFLEFGWVLYKEIGADADIIRMFFHYQTFLTLLKLDLFFWLAFLVQYIMVLLEFDWWLTLTIIALVLTPALFTIAVYGVTKESYSFTLIFNAGELLGMVYFILRIVKVWNENISDMLVLNFYLTFFAGLSLTMHLITFVWTIICLRNFGNGLKENL